MRGRQSPRIRRIVNSSFPPYGNLVSALLFSKLARLPRRHFAPFANFFRFAATTWAPRSPKPWPSRANLKTAGQRVPSAVALCARHLQNRGVPFADKLASSLPLRWRRRTKPNPTLGAERVSIGKLELLEYPLVWAANLADRHAPHRPFRDSCTVLHKGQILACAEPPYNPNK